MVISKKQFGFGLLAIVSGITAWLSLGGSLECGHFNLHVFCEELESNNEANILKRCSNLANQSVAICHNYFKLSIGALIVCTASTFVFVQKFMDVYVEDNWNE